MADNAYTLLALGDSYTVGESIPLHESFPYRSVQFLRNNGFNFHAPEIIARTGWTTDELLEAISQIRFLPEYDFVCLLIGVNNQYRGQTPDNYKPGFESLLKQAIQFSGKRNNHVIVLSIPDWSITPFANANLPDKLGRSKEQVAGEIDAFNAVNRSVSEKFRVNYIEITQALRESAGDHSLLAVDGLHPSAGVYKKWAEQVNELIMNQLKLNIPV